MKTYKIYIECGGQRIYPPVSDAGCLKFNPNDFKGNFFSFDDMFIGIESDDDMTNGEKKKIIEKLMLKINFR